jgi:hypothetical protein
MENDTKLGIWVVGDVVERGEQRSRLQVFDVQDVARQIGLFGKQLVDVLAELPLGNKGFFIDEITVSAEVEASGKLSLLGSGMEAKTGTGLTFVLKRRPDSI